MNEINGLDAPMLKLANALSGQNSMANALSGQNSLANALSGRNSMDIAQLKIADQARQYNKEDARLSEISPNLGVMAPMVAGIKNLARQQNRIGKQRTMDELYSRYENAQAQDMERARLAAIEKQKAKEAADLLKHEREKELIDYKFSLEPKAAPVELNPYDPASITGAGKMRDNFMDDAKGLMQAEENYRVAIETGNVFADPNSTPADRTVADQALVRLLIKTYDDSAVMQGEFDGAAEAQALVGVWRKKADFSSGEILTDDTRRAMLKAMDKIQKARLSRLKGMAADTIDNAREYYGPDYVRLSIPNRFLNEEKNRL